MKKATEKRSSMNVAGEAKIAAEIDALGQMTVGQLRSKYGEAFGEATHSRNRRFLQKRVAWRIQANAFGGISERARKRAEELANDSDLRIRAPRGQPPSIDADSVTEAFQPSIDARTPTPGSILTRDYQGKRLVVSVLEKGFEFEGRVFRSLTGIAEAVTGSHWNGRHFFGLNRQEAV